MYLNPLSKSIHKGDHTKDVMLNYHSFESLQKFQNGWVREVLVKEIFQKSCHWEGIGKSLHIYLLSRLKGGS